MTDELDEILKLLREALPRWSAHYGVRNVRVFGSIARGDSGPTSDLDLLVDFETTPSLFKMASIKLEAEELTGRRVDVIMEAGLRPSILNHALKDAVTV